MLDLSFTFTPLYKLDDPESISFTTSLPTPSFACTNLIRNGNGVVQHAVSVRRSFRWIGLSQHHKHEPNLLQQESFGGSQVHGSGIHIITVPPIMHIKSSLRYLFDFFKKILIIRCVNPFLRTILSRKNLLCPRPRPLNHHRRRCILLHHLASLRYDLMISH